jgi:hypothetical protein
MNMTAVLELKKHLKGGKTYRRAELAQWSKSVDRHLLSLVKDGSLKKLRAGLYYCPKQSVFGEVPVDDYELVRTFLKDDRFLLTSPNEYNSLGLGMTQLYNLRVVYNHKRHGHFVLGGREYDFRVKHHFPHQAVSEEFLIVDLVNNLNDLAEDRDSLLERVSVKVKTMNSSLLKRAVHEYATISARKFFESVLNVQ